MPYSYALFDEVVLVSLELMFQSIRLGSDKLLGSVDPFRV